MNKETKKQQNNYKIRGRERLRGTKSHNFDKYLMFYEHNYFHFKFFNFYNVIFIKFLSQAFSFFPQPHEIAEIGIRSKVWSRINTTQLPLAFSSPLLYLFTSHPSHVRDSHPPKHQNTLLHLWLHLTSCQHQHATQAKTACQRKHTFESTKI